jgi:hypothetical protein
MLIDGTDGFSCVGSFRTMEEALEKIEANPRTLFWLILVYLE